MSLLNANEVKKTVNFCNKVASNTISKYNQLKLLIDNNKFNQNTTKIHLDDMFTTGLKEFKEVNNKTDSAVDETLIKKRNEKKVRYVKAILLEGKLVDNNEQARLEMHYDFNHEDKMKEIEGFFTI